MALRNYCENCQEWRALYLKYCMNKQKQPMKCTRPLDSCDTRLKWENAKLHQKNELLEVEIDKLKKLLATKLDLLEKDAEKHLEDNKSVTEIKTNVHKRPSISTSENSSFIENLSDSISETSISSNSTKTDSIDKQSSTLNSSDNNNQYDKQSSTQNNSIKYDTYAGLNDSFVGKDPSHHHEENDKDLHIQNLEIKIKELERNLSSEKRKYKDLEIEYSKMKSKYVMTQRLSDTKATDYLPILTYLLTENKDSKYVEFIRNQYIKAGGKLEDIKLPTKVNHKDKMEPQRSKTEYHKTSPSSSNLSSSSKNSSYMDSTVSSRMKQTTKYKAKGIEVYETIHLI